MVWCYNFWYYWQIDETVEPPDYMERAEDGMNLIMARLLAILDSWISFEDNVMIELDAAEDASQRVMRGSVGEVGLVTGTSEVLLDDVFAQVSSSSSEVGMECLQRYAGVIWLVFFIEHLHLIVVWLGDNQRTNAIAIGRHLQILSTTPYSIVNTIGRTSIIQLRINKHAFPITSTK